MLREYRLTNFKAFGETVTIPIRPLTLIFGANSSGKSSIFQSLLLLKQTLEEAKNPETALLPKGSFVDLGTYRDFVHRHETKRDFEFGVRFDLEKDDADLSAQFSYEEEKGDATFIYGATGIGGERQPIISYFPYDDTEPVMVNSDLDFWRRWWNTRKSDIQYELRKTLEIEVPNSSGGVEILVRNDDEVHGFHRLIEELEDFPEQPEWEDGIFEEGLEYLKNKLKSTTVCCANFLPTKFEFRKENFEMLSIPSLYIGISRLAKEIFLDELDINPIIRPICNTFRSLFKNLVYLGPLRSQPERYYTFSGDTTDYVGQSGEYLPSILFQRPELVGQINKDLEELDLKYRVKLDKLQYEEDSSPSNIFSLRLVHTDTGINASLRDVGFGISQVLPIVVQNRLSKEKTLLIEQPEIHLHPAHQAELGDMFIRSALREEKEQRNTILLETHSEHLMLRILRRIRETSENEPLPEGIPAIRPEDVAVLYVQPGEGDEGAQIIEIPVTADGDFAEKWPRGFFTERVKELF